MNDSEKRDELGDDAVHKMGEFLERFKHRLTLDNPRLAERYVKVEIDIHVLFRLRGQNVQYVARFQRAQAPCVRDAKHNRRIEQDSVAELLKFPSQLCGESNSGAHVGSPCNEQEVVLVDVVQAMNLPKEVIPTRIRLGRVDEVYRRLAYSLYFSRRVGLVILGTLIDREGGLNSDLVPISHDQLASQVVQSGSQVLDRISGDKGQLQRSVNGLDDVVDQVTRFRIALGPDFVWFGIQKGPDCPVEIDDVLFGPFGFRPDAD